MAMLQVAPESVILRDTIRTRAIRLTNPETIKQNNSISVNLVEFDDVSYRLTASAGEPNKLLVSLALPPQEKREPMSKAATELVQREFSSVATMQPPDAGFTVALEIKLDALPMDDDAALNQMINKLASLRSLVMGAPLRTQLELLANGSCKEGPLIAIPHRPGEEFFVKPQEDSVTVIFPMRFKDPSDATISCTFLAEFAEARRQPALTTAPSCSYSKPPPLELRGGPPTALGANGGYVSFVLFKRHVTGKGRLEQSTWRLSTFYGFVNYHIKCSKAYMHTRMRKRTQGLLQVLNRAKPDVVKEKKKADGRTFVRNS